jgi:hypothetical protein
VDARDADGEKTMKKHLPCAAIAAQLLGSLFLDAPAEAGAIAVNNPSFETLPAGGLPNTDGCGSVPGCAYSIDQIPGWTVTGELTGQFQPGTTPNMFFNSLPDGPTIAYTNDGSITQTVSTLAAAGVTYTLTVDRFTKGRHQQF